MGHLILHSDHRYSEDIFRQVESAVVFNECERQILHLMVVQPPAGGRKDMIPVGATMMHTRYDGMSRLMQSLYAQVCRQNFPVVVLTLTQGRSIGGYGG
jgi:hypothetical protein